MTQTANPPVREAQRNYLLTIRKTGIIPDERPSFDDCSQDERSAVFSIESLSRGCKGKTYIIEEKFKQFEHSVLARILGAENNHKTEAPQQGGDKPNDIPSLFDGISVPDLPPHVKANEAEARLASPILDAMIAYIKYWATRSYKGYYEAVALWVLATIAARRVFLDWRKGVWTVLYIMLVSDSTAYAKTDAASYGDEMLKQCGLSYLLAPDDFSPQKLLVNMEGLRVPRNYSCMTDEQKEWLRKKYTFSAQKGWLFDEFGNKLQEIINAKAGYMSTLYSLIKKLYDCKTDHEYDTFSHDLVHIDMPYLSLIGTATPACLKPIASKGSAVWTDGLFARIAFVVPPKDTYELKSAPKGHAYVPGEIITALTEWHERLGIPSCEIKDVEEEEELLEQALGPDDKKKKKKQHSEPYRVERSPLPQQRVGMDDAVYQAHEDYYKALVTIAMDKKLDERFKSSYGRLPEKALRIAMLLASLEGRKQSNPTVEMRHWARGQAIAERWRYNFHELIAQLESDAPTVATFGELEDAVINVLTTKFPDGEKVSPQMVRDKGSTLIRNAGTPKIRSVLDELYGQGMVAKEGKGRDALYRLKPSAAKTPLQQEASEQVEDLEMEEYAL